MFKFRKKIILFIFLLCFLSTSFFPSVQCATIDDRINTDLNYQIYVGDWLGYKQKNLEIDENGTVQTTNTVKVAFNVERAEKIGAKYFFKADLYSNISQFASYPLQNGEIDFNDWEFQNQLHLEMNTTRKGLVTPFFLPMDLMVKDVYVQLENNEDYFFADPLELMFNFTQLTEPYFDELLYYNKTQTLRTTQQSVFLQILEIGNITTTISPNYVYTYILNSTYYFEFDPIHHIMRSFNILASWRKIDYMNGVTITSDHINGGGTELSQIYDSNIHRGEWFYQNWQWFIPILILSSIGIILLIWWQGSIKKCNLGQENIFCRNNALYRQKKYINK